MPDTEHIQLAHGGGGQLTAELIEQVILPALGAKAGTQRAGALADAALVNMPAAKGKVVFTTDSYVVWPLEFPGADIGKLAVCGTVNDLAVCGAGPVAISLALVLEEGLEISLLRRVLQSAGAAARQAKVAIVTGDTKVVERGGVAGMIVNTSGVGRLLESARLGFGRIRGGDSIILSGPLGEHGLAVMGQRKGLSFRAELVSDCAPLGALTADLLAKLGSQVRFMRDPTRSGLAATLVDIANGCGRDVEIVEDAIPVNRTARAAAEMLGLDLLSIANEGKLVAVVARSAANHALSILKKHAVARQAAVIGSIGPKADGPMVEMVTAIGGRRIVQMPYGEELPRIC